jgi:rfaE bifunctional protein kinase chain/domain
VPGPHELAALLPRLRGRRVLVHADLVADEFVLTGAARVSREAPVLILQHVESRIVPGGGANAAANIASLGGVPIVVGEVGDDEAGRALTDALRDAGADTSGILVRPGHLTPRKSRILAGDVNVARQQVVRIDRIEPFVHDESFLRSVKAHVVRAMDRAHGVLVSDYGLGFVDPESVEALILHAPARRGLKVALDSRHRLFEYPGIDVATPSQPEVETALAAVPSVAAQGLEACGREALTRTRGEALVLTRGSLGLWVLQDGEPTISIPAFGPGTVADVTGAGDTVIAALTLALAAGATYLEAAALANAAAGVAVSKAGTAVVGAAELEHVLLAHGGGDAAAPAPTPPSRPRAGAPRRGR